jgi:hypothetical protein
MGVDFGAEVFLSMSDERVCLSLCDLRFDLGVLMFWAFEAFSTISQILYIHCLHFTLWSQ